MYIEGKSGRKLRKKKRERNEEKGGKRGEKMPIRTIRKNILTVYCLGRGEFRR